MSQKFFNGIGAENFDQHIENSIPGYSTLISQVKAVAKACTSQKYGILDVGCSTGKMLKHLDESGNRCRKVGVDLSDLIGQQDTGPTSPHSPMLIKRDWLESSVLAWLEGNEPFEVVTSIFFLQFLPFTERSSALERMSNALVPGGRILLAEKVYFKGPQIQRSVDAWHRQYKLESFSSEDILRKDKMVAEEMQLQTDEGIRQELKKCGFHDVDVLFSMAGFTLYTAVKEV